MYSVEVVQEIGGCGAMKLSFVGALSLILLSVSGANAACPALSKVGDQVDLAFHGGPLLRGANGSIQVTREPDGITATESDVGTNIGGDRLFGPIIVSEGNRYKVWQYDRDIKDVVAHFPPGRVRLQATVNIAGQRPVSFPVEYMTLGESEFTIEACAYHVYKIERTIQREDESSVYVSTLWFAPNLGFYVRTESQLGNIGKPLGGAKLLYEVSGFGTKGERPK
jgi:hypothetical protein